MRGHKIGAPFGRNAFIQHVCDARDRLFAPQKLLVPFGGDQPRRIAELGQAKVGVVLPQVDAVLRAEVIMR